MTSTTTPPTRRPAPPSDLLHAAVPTEPAGRPDAAPRRRRARFPGPPAQSTEATSQGRPQVRWLGSEVALLERVRDHATAVGMDLVDASGDGSSAGRPAAVVIDGAALADDARPLPGPSVPLLVVMDGPEVPVAAWKRALGAGARAVITLPDGSDELLSLLAELARPRAASTLVAVTGGCGGAGASSFAARLAAAARSSGPVVLVDADPLGGGLDLLVEGVGSAGIGWADAAGLGPDDGEALREGLPRVDEVSLLAAQDHGGPDASSLSKVLSALAPLGGTVIVDLASALVPVAAEHADRVLLVVPTSDHAVRAAARRLRSWPQLDPPTQVVARRRGPLSPPEVCEDLALPLAGSFRDSPRGTVPLLDVRRGGADRAARRLLARPGAEHGS